MTVYRGNKPPYTADCAAGTGMRWKDEWHPIYFTR